MRRPIKIALVFALLLLVAVGWLLLRPHFFHSASKTESDPRDYRSNPHWTEQTKFYSLYTDSPKIVFLGTSLTARISWSEALRRPGAAGRGVNGDITAGILARVPFVTATHPAICFIEGGINDLDRGLPGGEIVNNLITAAGQLEAAGVQPVLTAVFPVTDSYPDSRVMNARIDTVNLWLSAICLSRGFKCLNINQTLAPSGTRLPQYARGDGLHLTATAYRVWIAAADSILRQKGL